MTPHPDEARIRQLWAETRDRLPDGWLKQLWVMDRLESDPSLLWMSGAEPPPLGPTARLFTQRRDWRITPETGPH
jgi:hypothetical protein